MFFCLAAMTAVGALYYLFLAVPAGHNPVFYKKILPAAGLIFSCLILFFGHFSYSRLHSVRVYFSGYCAGCAGIVYFTLCKAFIVPASFPPLPHGYSELVICLMLLNLVAVTLIPSGTKYRIIRSVTLGIIAVETVLFCILRFGPGAPLWLDALAYHTLQEPAFWVGPAFLAAALLLSFWCVRSEFFLGGIIAGCAIMLVAAWASRLIAPVHADQFRLLMLTGIQVYFFGGLVAHGFLRMEHRIAYDPLLKIYNRDYCSRIITEQANLDVSPPFGIAMVDIDHFKEVNDTYGHQAGDAVLHAVAQVIQRRAGPDGIACRYGGEELAVFFPQRTAREVGEIAEEMRKDIEKANTNFNRKTIQVTISAGVSHREQYGQSIVEVIQAADKALYAAKKEGRNQVRQQKTPAKSR